MSTAYERVLARRAKRLGVSLDEAAKVTGEPRYLQAAKAAAVRLGTTPEAILEADLKRLNESTYDFSDYEEPTELPRS